MVAGLGNLYTNELCFLRGLSPWLPVGELPAGGLEPLVALGRRLLLANRETAAQVTTGDARRGRQHWVFERTRQPCRRCGTPIRSAEQGDAVPRQRLTYWCPTCQPSPLTVRLAAVAARRVADLAGRAPPGTPSSSCLT